MIDPSPSPTVPSEVQMAYAKERTKHVTAAGWTAGTSAVFCAYALMGSPTWPLAVGVVALAVMVSFVCWMMLSPGLQGR